MPTLADVRRVVDNSPTLRNLHDAELAHRSSTRVDYSLARRATLSAHQAGRLSRFEICDAHPELMRAAKFCGEKITDPCPICDKGPLVLVSYVFSDEFSKRDNGRVWLRGDLAPLLQHREVRLYTVEVCVDCSWNHVRGQLMLSDGGSSEGGTPGKRGRRASAAPERRGRRATT